MPANLADVTHLRRIYEVLSKRLEETGRSGWVQEEVAVLTDPATYRSDPAEAWARIKTRSTAPRFLAALKELARFRETVAQRRNVPRARTMCPVSANTLAWTCSASMAIQRRELGIHPTRYP